MNWSGIVAIDKPPNWSSREVVDRIVRIVRPAKAGHAGTLDPLATGVLVVAIGPATRLISYIQQGKKRYVAGCRLGLRSNTDDIDGELTDGGDWSEIVRSDVCELLTDFVGVIQQTPPQFSAVHVGGRRAYALARQGESVDLKSRPVEVNGIGLTRFEPPDLELDIECGSGTYVRSIIRDLGDRLGCGAIMTSLRRMGVGSFDLTCALDAESLNAQILHERIQPPLQAVPHLTRLKVSADEIRAIRQGRTIAAGTALEDQSAEIVLIDDDDQLIAICRPEMDGTRLQPCVVLPAATAAAH